MREYKQAKLNKGEYKKMEEEQILKRDGNYFFKALPFDNRTWKETEKVEIVFLVETEEETKSFRGVLDLSGIIKKNN